MKRSEGLRGFIPHFFHVRERKSKELVLIDYIPRKRKHGLLDRGDSVLVFVLTRGRLLAYTVPDRVGLQGRVARFRSLALAPEAAPGVVDGKSIRTKRSKPS